MRTRLDLVTEPNPPRTDLPNRAVAVIGAYGHTGRFVVAELHRRGLVPILSGRDAAQLRSVAEAHAASSNWDIRPASMDDPAALDRALAGAAAVINCAGPFATTAAPVLEAALRARIPYLDIAAEVEAITDTFAQYAGPAREAGVVVVPGLAFYGGLGDLLATTAMDDWPGADRISIAYALSSWRPTPGTRATGQVSATRRDGRRIIYTNHRLEFRTGAAPLTEWTFPAPIGTEKVMAEFTMADSATIPTHLKTPEIQTYMTLAAIDDLRAPDPSPPQAVDEKGRSAQTFLVQVEVHRAGETRRAAARGQDIYAVTAPLVVEATHRILAGPDGRTGVLAAGDLFDATEFLTSVAPAITMIRG
jgi:hypothetical protein